MKPEKLYLIYLVVILIMPACSQHNEVVAQYADVTQVDVSGEEDRYTFSVTVKSPDTGCDQYADWWEVISPDGKLIYRRILLHSHTNEQPFTRSGGPVDIGPETKVIIRAHMNNTGYGGEALQGTISGGFTRVELSGDFASHLESRDPLPSACAF